MHDPTPYHRPQTMSIRSSLTSRLKKEWDVGSCSSVSDCGSSSLTPRHEPSETSHSTSSTASKRSNVFSAITGFFSSCFGSTDGESTPGFRVKPRKKRRIRKLGRRQRTPTIQELQESLEDYFSEHKMIRAASHTRIYRQRFECT